jgi:hypothetical protein
LHEIAFGGENARMELVGLIDSSYLLTNLDRSLIAGFIHESLFGIMHDAVHSSGNILKHIFNNTFSSDVFGSDVFGNMFHNMQHLIAQATGGKGQFNQDVVGDMAKGWNNFIRTGQWATLLIGLVIGYMFRVFTSSG